MEQRYLDQETRKLIRPFSEAAEVKCRGRSRRLELALVDFAADLPFKTAAEKIKRHYGVEVCESTTQYDVYKHARTMQANDYALSGKAVSREVKTIVAEADGGMIPTVSRKDQNFVGDQRKNRLREWREARLTLARPSDEVDPIYSAKMGPPEEIGKMIQKTVARAGRGDKTKIHFVGDGALWIAEQVELIFGADASYLLDIFHACEYVSDAAKCCAPANPTQWRETQRENLKKNQSALVFTELKSHAEVCPLAAECPALICYNYLVKRVQQLNYKDAIASDLPIGSGEIEGGIRAVVQKRLKVSGGWNPDNAQKMLHLRTVAANKRLDAYGQDLRNGTLKVLS